MEPTLSKIIQLQNADNEAWRHLALHSVMKAVREEKDIFANPIAAGQEEVIRL